MEAVILAGGRGTRLRSAVPDLPKPMAPVGNRPFLCYLLDTLERAEFSRVILSVGYRHEVIQDFFGEEWHGVSLEYCVEDTPLGTGGAIKAALARSSEDYVLIMNGDTFFEVDYSALYSFGKTKDAPITIAVKEMKEFDRYGSLEIINGRIVRFREKTFTEQGVINGGIYLMQRNLLETVTQRKFSLEQDFIEQRARDMEILAFESKGYFIDIGIPEDYMRAQKELPLLV